MWYRTRRARGRGISVDEKRKDVSARGQLVVPQLELEDRRTVPECSLAHHLTEVIAEADTDAAIASDLEGM